MALTQYDWHPYKKGKSGHRHVHKESIRGRLEVCCQKQATGRSQEGGLEQTFPSAFGPFPVLLGALYLDLRLPSSRAGDNTSATQSVVLCLDSLSDIIQWPQVVFSAQMEMMWRAAVQDRDQADIHCGRGCGHCCLPRLVQSLAKGMPCQALLNCVFKQFMNFYFQCNHPQSEVQPCGPSTHTR